MISSLGKPRFDVRRDIRCFRRARARTPRQLAAIAGVPISRDLVGEIVCVDAAEYSGDKKGALRARGVESRTRACECCCSSHRPRHEAPYRRPLISPDRPTIVRPARFGSVMTASSGTSTQIRVFLSAS
ncbi:hypothetical protein K7461_29375, partial [Pseudomonas fluorescens]|uniref:hypothetical protein n=1 Tax=Pseudomonas fluorescens TaxID=294 RepID=UPI001CA61831